MKRAPVAPVAPRSSAKQKAASTGGLLHEALRHD